jgi:hypothetical protein
LMVSPVDVSTISFRADAGTREIFEPKSIQLSSYRTRPVHGVAVDTTITWPA